MVDSLTERAVVVDYNYNYDPKGIYAWRDQDRVSGHIIVIVSLGGYGRVVGAYGWGRNKYSQLGSLASSPSSSERIEG